jgi:hypothetical protein
MTHTCSSHCGSVKLSIRILTILNSHTCDIFFQLVLLKLLGYIIINFWEI